MSTKPANDAMTLALATEGINYPSERAERIIARLKGTGWEVTRAGNWEERPAQALSLIQDEI